MGTLGDDWDPDDEITRGLEADGVVLRIRVETRRYGKHVTVIEGFPPGADVRDLSARLKRAMGAGGTFREGAVELQGDHTQKAREVLERLGYRVAP